ncbi:MAG: transposase [Sodalis sp. (in: enterobacteria)]|uniref:transposase n=1 Tax=Sodalis sp. (in: enterobacteria) TaxID=1898979 RepID=UPI0039E5E260
MKQTPPKPSRPRPNFPLDFKIKLVEQALQSGVSIAKLARDNGINDNLLFNWCQLYCQGKFGVQPKIPTTQQAELLTVTLTAEPSPLRSPLPSAEPVTCDIEFTGARLRLAGNLTPALLCALIHELKGPQS